MQLGLQQMVDLVGLRRNDGAYGFPVSFEFVYLGPIRAFLDFLLLGISVAPHKVTNVKYPFVLVTEPLDYLLYFEL